MNRASTSGWPVWNSRLSPMARAVRSQLSSGQTTTLLRSDVSRITDRQTPGGSTIRPLLYFGARYVSDHGCSSREDETGGGGSMFRDVMVGFVADARAGADDIIGHRHLS